MSELLDIRNIDRSSWSKFRFEQIAKSISERVEPKDSNLDIYVGLEHLDPDTIHIRRTGKPADVDGTKLKFYKGDVIFGRRRAYQRKAALSEFNGICSAHSLVLRANPEVIDSNLFPFFLHSDLFMHRAIDISVGSLSPTINWGTLKNQEFLIPPKDQQPKLAELLWTGDEMIEKHKIIHAYLSLLLTCLIDSKIKSKPHSKSTLLKDCLLQRPQYGANAPSIPYVPNTPRYIRITDMNDEGALNSSDFVSINMENYFDYLLDDDDFLFARTGATVGKTLLYKKEMGLSVFAGYLIKFKVDKSKLLPGFLNLFCKTEYYKDFLRKSVKVGAQPNIN
ncbi:MAG: restriction endonuclease subunit S, partial [Bacteroidales bacterium]|nr:restriction endonuclease subunit S [Bacteroidales bacterium]